MKACHSEPFAVILSPSLVILSGAKNLALPLRLNSARNLARNSLLIEQSEIPHFVRNDRG
jgi:hypothetical protein